MAGTVLAVAETRDGSIKRVSYEIVTAARELAGDGGKVVALLIGAGVRGHVAQLGAHGATQVFLADAPDLATPTAEVVAGLAAQVASACSPDAILFPASMQGKDASAALAARLDVGLATDCTSVRIEGGNFAATRPVYAGKVIANVEVTTKPFMASLRPNAVTATPGSGGGDPEVVEIAFEGTARVQLAQVVPAETTRPDVAEADIIVCGGRSLGSAENFGLLEQLADALGPTCGVGASRAAVDAGYRKHRDQIGQTGKTVSPALYFAIGISGAIQHLAGMTSSKVIVAINKDPEAPIFKVADYGIVGDLFEVVPALTEAIKAIER